VSSREERERHEAPAEAERDSVHKVARGRWSGTPFAVIATVAAVLWGVAAFVAVALVLVWWLG
jgi:hypothetical protein